MLRIAQGTTASNCQGHSRRTALKAGLLGLSGLGLGDLLRLQAEASVPRTDTAVILMWLDGGPSHMDSYDPKPDAPIENRGPWGAISTSVPGMQLSETLPLHAKHADKLALVRSVHHNTGDHFAAGHWMLTGKFGATSVNAASKYPGVGAYVAKVRGTNEPGLPAFVGLPAAQSIYLFPGYQGSAYLGSAYNPFDVDRQYCYLGTDYPMPPLVPRCLENFERPAASLEDRVSLLSSLDTLERRVDASGQIGSLDRYQQQALSLILSGKVKRAIDMTKEDPRAMDKYGRNPWGFYTLMARRLVEAGVTFVTVDMPHWDDHSNIYKSHGRKLEVVDQAVWALLDDLVARDLFGRVLLVVMGEFGRTPYMNKGQPGSDIPGRDHWGEVFSVMLAGGGLRGGQIVGRSQPKGDQPAERPLKPGDVLATIYRVLGIDHTLKFNDFAGRPVAILDEGEPIRELF